MITIGVCVATSVLCAWIGPRLLMSGHWQVRFPRLALVSWHAALGLGLLSLLGSIVAAVAASFSAQHATDTATGIMQSVAGWIALGLAGAGLVIVSVSSDQLTGASHRAFADVLSLPHARERLDRRSTLLTLRIDEPFACAIPGSDATVVISTALRDILTAAQLRAVIAHERAHLRGRHYLAVRLAELSMACLPSCHAGKHLLRASTLLVELIADDEAARRAGAVHLANALVIVASHTNDPTMELRAERLADRTWVSARRLARAKEVPRS